MKKVLFWILGIVAALCIAVLCVWGGELSTLGTVEDTQYSNVYDQSDITLDLRNWNDYDNPVAFSLAR